jgi:hypothetical protein
MPAWIAGIQARRMRPDTSMSPGFRQSVPERRHREISGTVETKLNHNPIGLQHDETLR